MDTSFSPAPNTHDLTPVPSPESSRPEDETKPKSLKELAQEQTESAIACLIEIMTAKKDGEYKYGSLSRSAAAKEILDRGHGKAKQETEHVVTFTYQDALNQMLTNERNFRQITTVDAQDVIVLPEASKQLTWGDVL